MADKHRVTLKVHVDPWVGPFISMFVRMRCGSVALEQVLAYARRNGMQVR